MMYGLEKTILTSLCICFLYEAYKPSMIFFPIRRLMEKGLSYLPEKVNLYVRKPLFSCVICMSSVYGILFTWNIITFSFAYVLFLFQVAGLNFLISLIIHFFHDKAEEDLQIHKVIEAKEEEVLGMQSTVTEKIPPFNEPKKKLKPLAFIGSDHFVKVDIEPVKKKPIIKKKIVKPK